MNKAKKITLGAVLLAHMGSGVVVSFLAHIWQDENFYFGGSLYVVKGLLPYRDFFAYHNPLAYYINAIPQWLFGPSLLAGRLFSLGLSTITLLLIMRLSYRLAGFFTALIASLLYCSNLFYLQHMATSVTYHPLCVFLVACFMTLYFSNLSLKTKTILSSLMIALMMGVRYPLVDFLMPVFALFFLYLIVKAKGERIKTLFWILLGLSPLFLIYGIFLTLSGENFFFDTVTFSASGGQQNVLALKSDFISFLKWRYRFFLHLLMNNGVPMLLFSLLFLLVLIKNYKLKEKEWMIPKEFFWMTSLFFLVTEVILIFPNAYQTVWHYLTIPFLCVFIGVGMATLYSQWKTLPLRGAIVCSFLGLVIAGLFFQKPALSKGWEGSDIQTIQKVSRHLQADGNQNDESIFTFIPVYVLNAGHRVSLNMIHEVYQIIPSLPEEGLRKYHLVNTEMILEEIQSRKPGAILLQNPGRLEDNKFAGKVLNGVREALKEAIDQNYSVSRTFELSEGRGKIIIYTRNKPHG